MYFSSHKIMISSWFYSIVPLSFLKTIAVSFFITTFIFQTKDACPYVNSLKTVVNILKVCFTSNVHVHDIIHVEFKAIFYFLTCTASHLVILILFVGLDK